MKQEYDKAVADCLSAIEVDPKEIDALARCTRACSVVPTLKLIDAKKAVESAQKVCELTGWKDVSDLSFLAAAHARAGDFASAVKWQTKAVELVTDASDKQNLISWLDCYKAGKTCIPEECSEARRPSWPLTQGMIRLPTYVFRSSVLPRYFARMTTYRRSSF